jgi:dihydrofolate reductase
MGKHFKAIAAMARNRVIGKENKLPWYLPEELKWFKRTTSGHVLIMGRKTFESIGRPLPNRETIVLSQSGFTFPGVRTVASLTEIDPNSDAREYFVVGGAQIYAHALRMCSDLFLTVVDRDVEGDAFFPPFENTFPGYEVVFTHPEFEIRHYKNPALS